VRPPVLRTQEADGERRPTWTELFFDLVFVAAVSRTSQILADDPSASGAAWFAFLFVALTWSWSNFVMYTERFDTDDVPHRLTKAAAMVAVASLAYTAPDVRGDRAVEFALAYCAMRAVLIGLYVRAWRHVVEVRSAIAVYLVGFSLRRCVLGCVDPRRGRGAHGAVDRRRGRRARHPIRRLAAPR
jgi:low temperature requirement protein LtrA